MSDLAMPEWSGEPPAWPASFQIGEWVVDATEIAVPGGRIPIGGTSWRLNETNAYRQTTPTYAIVLAIVLIPCTAFLSLLFLLANERVVSGLVVVEMTSRAMTLSTTIPVSDPQGLDWIRKAVQQAQAWSFAAMGAS